MPLIIINTAYAWLWHNNSTYSRILWKDLSYRERYNLHQRFWIGGSLYAPPYGTQDIKHARQGLKFCLYNTELCAALDKTMHLLKNISERPVWVVAYYVLFQQVSGYREVRQFYPYPTQAHTLCSIKSQTCRSSMHVTLKYATNLPRKCLYLHILNGSVQTFSTGLIWIWNLPEIGSKQPA
jgi:hypothetical protein